MQNYIWIIEQQIDDDWEGVSHYIDKAHGDTKIVQCTCKNRKRSREIKAKLISRSSNVKFRIRKYIREERT